MNVAGYWPRSGWSPDPRNPRGVRYPLTALLTVAVCAVLAGATSFTAMVGR